MRLINAENLEKTLEAAITMMEKMASAIGAEDDEGIQMELKAYKDILGGIKEEAPVEAVSLDWIRSYIDRLKAMGAAIANRDAQAVSVMADKWAMEQNGNATCGPDYCEIGGHDEQA